MFHEIFTPVVLAVFFARVFLGLLFFFQGKDAVFGVGLKQVVDTVSPALSDKGVPRFLIITGSWFTSFAALIGGTLLLLGLFKYAALYLLGIDLVIAAGVFGMVKPMWDMQHVFPRLALLLFLLLVPVEWDIISFDSLFDLNSLQLFKN